MHLRTLLLSAVVTAGLSIQAQTAVMHSFRAAAPVDPSQEKHLIEAIVNIDPTAVLLHSDDWTIIQVKSTSGLIESAYRSALGNAGVTLDPGTPDLVALGLVPAAPPSGVPVYVVTDDPASDLSRYQAAVDEWNLAHPDQPVSRTPIHQTR